MGKLKNNRFKNKETENFYLGEKIHKLQEISKSEKQVAHRKITLVRQAKNWAEIILYFPYGASGSRLEKIGKDQYSIRLNKKYLLLFRWNKSKHYAYDIYINPHDKTYGKQK